jgi:hypothetical protein
MKKLICLAFLSFNLLANGQGAISLPELAILYRGYQNKIEVGYTGMESCNISVVGGSVSPVTWTDENGLMHSGYNVMVASGTREVSITLTGKDKKGKSVNYGTYHYKVMVFPKPSITEYAISKSSGFITNVNLGEYFPIKKYSFTVTDVKVNDVIYSGNIVPASAVSKNKVGDKVVIEASVSNDVSGDSTIILGFLTVIE